MARFSLTRRFVVLAGVPLVAAAISHAQCDPEWSDRFALPGIDGSVHDAVRFNDGSGEKIYLAGNLRNVGSISDTGRLGNSYGVVRWDGTSWEAVGTGFGSAPGCGSFEGGGTVHALAVYDPDGPGGQPASLYAGGDFFFSNCVLTRCVARWDVPTSSWQPLKGGLFRVVEPSPGLTAAFTPRVVSMTTYDPDGAGPLPNQLYVAGVFNRASNVASGDNTGFKTYGIARWNGNTEMWSNVGGEGINSTREGELLVYDDDGAGPIQPALYYGGRFTAVGGEPFVSLAVASQGFARWDGTTWTDVPGIAMEPNGAVYSIAAYDNGTTRSLWISGSGIIDGAGYARVAKRDDGSAAWPIVPIPGNPVRLMQYGNDMMAVAEWAGQPPNGFPVVYGQYESTLAKWSHASPTFTPVGKLFRTSTHPADGGGRVNFMFPCDFDLAGPGVSKLFIGGDFYQAGAQAMINVALWNGSGFERIVDGGSDGLGVHDFGLSLSMAALDPDGAGPMPTSLYLGSDGQMISAGDVSVILGAVRFDGANYHAINFPDAYPGITSMSVGGFVVHDNGSGPAVYCTGDINGDRMIFRLTGDTANRIAYMSGIARRLVSYNDGNGPALWAFGEFTEFSGVPANGVVKLLPNGTWVAADNGLPPGSRFGNAVVFNPGNGAKLFTDTLWFWNGSAWDTSAAPVITGDWFGDDIPAAMAVYNGELYIGGRFTSVAGVGGTNGIAKWNGTTWSDVGSGLNANVFVDDMQVHDDGTGPKLYVTGSISSAGMLAVQNLAIWNGSAWSTIDSGDTGCSFVGTSCYHASELESFGGALYMSGPFTVWDGKPANGLTAYERPCTPCPADFNGDGVRDVSDLFAYINAWLAKTINANSNNDSTVDVSDLFAYINAWLAGC